MPVYVDPLFTTQQKPRWPFSEACHMIADTVEELHAFAASIGLRRSWFQPKPAHYDLTRSKRYQAVKQGAIEIDKRELVKKLRDARVKEMLTQ